MLSHYGHGILLLIIVLFVEIILCIYVLNAKPSHTRPHLKSVQSRGVHATMRFTFIA